MASTEQIFTNATLVLPDETKVGTLVIKDGLIRDINFENTSIPRAEDLNKNYLLPGLVEVHTDNLERHCLPRPGVKWPLTAAVLSHDAELAAAGTSLSASNKSTKPNGAATSVDNMPVLNPPSLTAET